MEVQSKAVGPITYAAWVGQYSDTGYMNGARTFGIGLGGSAQQHP